MIPRYLKAASSRVLKSAAWRRCLTASVLTFSIALLSWKAYDSWHAIRSYSWQIHYARLLPSLAVYVVHTVMAFWTWQSLMGSLAQGLSLREHARVYALTNLIRRIPAGLLWSIAGRAYAYKSQDIPARTTVLASFLEIWAIILTGLPLAALAAPTLNLLPRTVALPLAALASVLALGMLHPRAIGKLLQLVLRETLGARVTYRETLSWAASYTLIWLVGGTGLFTVGRVFSDLSPVNLPAVIGAWVLSNIVSYFVLLSPGGLGLREVSLTFLLSVALPDPLPLLTALTMRLTWTGYDLVTGLAALLLEQRTPAV